MANKTYTLNSPVLHNGKAFKIGDKISLSDDDAEAIKQILTLEEKPKAKESGKDEGTGKDGNPGSGETGNPGTGEDGTGGAE